MAGSLEHGSNTKTRSTSKSHLGAFAAAPPPQRNWTVVPGESLKLRGDTAASDFAWQPTFPYSDPLPSGDPGANHRAAQLRVVESRVRDPPLFVAVSNGRLQNIGGCPGDSVICHRITFENGRWNEPTFSTAPAALCSNEAGWLEVGSSAPRAPRPPAAATHGARAGPEGRGRRCACPGTPAGAAPRAPGFGGLPGRRQASLTSRSCCGALAPALGAHVPACCGSVAIHHIWGPGNEWSLEGTPGVFLLHSCLASSHPVLSAPRALCMPPHPRVQLGVSLRGALPAALLGNPPG